MPIKRLKPVKSVVAGKALAPAKSVVVMPPPERLRNVEHQIAAITVRTRKLTLLSVFALIGGVVTFGVVVLLTWLFTDYIVFWTGIIAVLGGGASALCAKATGDLGNELRALQRERRELLAQIPQPPYGHAPVEAP
jgi:hypothetical protein